MNHFLDPRPGWLFFIVVHSLGWPNAWPIYSSFHCIILLFLVTLQWDESCIPRSSSSSTSLHSSLASRERDRLWSWERPRKSPRARFSTQDSSIPNGTLFKPKEEEETKLALFYVQFYVEFVPAMLGAIFLTQNFFCFVVVLTQNSRLARISSKLNSSRRKLKWSSLCVICSWRFDRLIHWLIDWLVESLIHSSISFCLLSSRKKNCFSILSVFRKQTKWKSVIHLWRRLLTRL